jgi:hypothetical protein
MENLNELLVLNETKTKSLKILQIRDLIGKKTRG